MMRVYARIWDGHVVELINTDGDISAMFHPDLVWLDITGSTPPPEEGWTYDGAEFRPPQDGSGY